MPHPQKSNVVEFQQPVVRFGEPIDEKQVTLLLMLAHAENSIFDWDYPKATWVIQRMLFNHFLPANDTGLRGCFGVIGPVGGTLEALTMIAVSQQWYTTKPYLEEYIVYVHPEHRTKGHASRLIDFLIDLSERMKIPLLTGILSQTRMEAKCRLYRRKLCPVGQFFMHMPASDPRWESEKVLTTLRSSSAAA